MAIPGQLIVVWAKFGAPAVMNEKILTGKYRDAYIDLNSATDPSTRHFITDLGADGIRKGGKNLPADSHDIGTKSIRFDGSWREDKMSEQDYMKAHADADEAYAKAVQALIDELKKSS